MPVLRPGRTLANPLYTGAPPYTGAWKDAAYDPELPGRVCTAEQIRVMPTLQQVMVEYSKAVARAAPGGTEQIVEFSAKWFAERVRRRRRGRRLRPCRRQTRRRRRCAGGVLALLAAASSPSVLAKLARS